MTTEKHGVTDSVVSHNLLGDFRDRLKVGVCFNYVGCYPDGRPLPLHYLNDRRKDRWEVESVEKLGVVVSHPGNKGHKHFIDWTTPITGIVFA